MRAFMVCRNYSVNGGMPLRNGIVQGLRELQVDRAKKRSHTSHRSHRSHGTSSSSIASDDDSSIARSQENMFSNQSRASSFSTAVSSGAPDPGHSLPLGIKNKVGSKSKLADLEAAVEDLNESTVYGLLEDSFEDISVGDYAWLADLQKLGLSRPEIARELLEKSRLGPWMFSPFEIPDVEPFADDWHIDGCVHCMKMGGKDGDAATSTQTRNGAQRVPNGDETTVRESIQYFCGLGGVRPAATGREVLQFGSVSFTCNNGTAVVSLSTSDTSETLSNILENVGLAAGLLQETGGCCNSFTFLMVKNSVVELHRMNLEQIRTMAQQLATTDTNPTEWELPLPVASMMRLSTPSHGRSGLHAIAAQFLSLAFLSYSQAHCGPIHPFYLDSPIQRVLLIGESGWGPEFRGPCIAGSLVELSCLGDMLQEPVFAFENFEQFDKDAFFSDSRPRADLIASPEDLLDTWGPGAFIAPQDNPEQLNAISLYGGLITVSKAVDEQTDQPVLHWSRTAHVDVSKATRFNRNEKIRIGARVSENDECKSEPHKQLLTALPLLEELGTYPSYWEVVERQLGFGAQFGQNAVGLVQFNQTWAKRRGMTKKSKILTQRSLYVADLEGLFGVQVSVCTGIARRVRLRELLADVLPAYATALVTEPRHWKSLVNDYNLLTALREGELAGWLEKLDHDLQEAFESLVLAVLFIMQDTGVDRNGENFIIGCIQPDLPPQCFRVPCRRENYWARMVADSEEIATFAYMTTRCLETDAVKCRGSGASWANSTSLFWTAVSYYHESQLTSRRASLTPSPPWSLKHSEAYLIGRLDAPLLVQVDRPNDQDEPRLLVSVSVIRQDILTRLYRKGIPGKPRWLRERKLINQTAETVMVLVNREY